MQLIIVAVADFTRWSLLDVHVGAGVTGARKEPCVVLADRERFAGRLPDAILAT